MNKTIIVIGLLLLILGCKKNQAPMIDSLVYEPESKKAGTVFTLKVIASDKDGDILTYNWNALEGTFLTDSKIKEVQWKSPLSGSGKTVTISVIVSDGENEVSQDIKILLEDPDLGAVDGHVYFTHFKIPVVGATVTIDDKTTSTDTLGYFVLNSLPAAECTLRVSKPEFTTSESTIHVPANGTLTVNSEISSVNSSTKLSGLVFNEDGLPVGSARVVVLNPDNSESKLVTTTNSSGLFRLWYIPFGERIILVTKSETNDTRYIDLKQTVIFKDIEAQLNLTIETFALSGQFTDPRDNHKYMFKTIGNVTWMTENLAFLPQVSPGKEGSTVEAHYYVYGYHGTDKVAAKATDNYTKYGVLYNWPAAVVACPPGWHLPTADREWDALVKPYTLIEAGTKLKSRTGWSEPGGDNATGFAAIPGGRLNDNGVFSGIENTAYFWLVSITGGTPIYKSLSSISSSVFSSSGSVKFGYSVRCVKGN
jgi:uncharacterized protein (TIGR02145 family)